MPAWFFRKFRDDFEGEVHQGLVQLRHIGKLYSLFVEVKILNTKKGRTQVMLTKGWRYYCNFHRIAVGDRVTIKRLDAALFEVSVEREVGFPVGRDIATESGEP